MIFRGHCARKSLMEKYIPRTHDEGKHPVIGNLYIASCLQDILRSRRWIIDESHKAIGKFPLRAQAMVDLGNLMGNREAMAFVYVPDAKHQSEGRFAEGRTLHIYDDTANFPMEIPPREFNLRRLRRTWISDVVILGIYHRGRMSDTFTLSHFINGSIHDPKRNLGTKLLRSSQ